MSHEINYNSSNVLFRYKEPVPSTNVSKRIHSGDGYFKHATTTASNVADVEYDKNGSQISSPFNITYSFHNESNKFITVIGRDSFRFSLKPLSKNTSIIGYNSSMLTNKILIQKKIVIHRSQAEEAKEFLNLAEHSDPNLLVIRDAFNQAYFSYAHKRPHEDKTGLLDYTIYVQYSIDLNELNQIQEDYYHVPTDFLLSTKPLKEVSPHPFSKSALHATKPECARYSVGVDFMIIDNDNEISDRFIMLGSDVYKIVPRIDKTKENGVYVSKYSYSATHQTRVIHESVCYPLDEADEKLGLFKTVEEAQSSGNISKRLEKDLLDAKNILRQRELEIERLKQEHEEKSLRFKDEFNDKEHRRKDQTTDRDYQFEQFKAQLERDKLVMNSKLEQMKAQNEKEKASMENIKLFFAGIVAIAGIGLATMKWYKSNT